MQEKTTDAIQFPMLPHRDAFHNRTFAASRIVAFLVVLASDERAAASCCDIHEAGLSWYLALVSVRMCFTLISFFAE